MSEQNTNDVFTFLAMRPAQAVPDTGPEFLRDPRLGTRDGGQQVAQLLDRLSEPGSAQEWWSSANLDWLEPIAARYRDVRHAVEVAPARSGPPGPATATTRMPPAGSRGPDPRFAAARAGHGWSGAVEEALAALRATLYPLPVDSELEPYAWNTLYAAYRFGAAAGPKLDLPTCALRGIHIDRLAQQGRIADAARAWRMLNAIPLVPPEVAAFPDAPRPPDWPVVEIGDEVSLAAPAEQLVREAAATHRLLDVLRDAPPAAEPVIAHDPSPVAGRSAARIAAMPTIGDVLPMETSDVDRSVLSGLDVDERTPLDVGVRKLTVHAAALAKRAYARRDEPGFAATVAEHGAPGLMALIPPVTQAVPARLLADEVVPDVNAVGMIRPLGIGDLKVVKQKLLGYQPGEVAHIENVLKGESKQRTFRVLDRTENTVFTAEESTQDTERDTQSTDRFEVKKEAETTIAENMSVQAGLTVTASFGPVTTTAHGDFAYATSKQESVRNSANFAREVVDKSVTKVQKKIKSERTTKTFHESEETDVHGVNNTAGTGHITGVYRWVDKRYRAQVYNYGRRLMFEFVVPEPAAYFRAAQARQVPVTDAQPPVPFRNALGNPLTADDITQDNYELIAGRYFTAGVVPPPAPFTYVGTTIDYAEGGNAKSFARSAKDFTIPAGYSLAGYHAEVSYSYQYYPKVFLAIEDRTFIIANTPSEDTGIAMGTGAADAPAPAVPGADYRARGSLPVTIMGYDIHAFIVTVQAICRSTPENYRGWQLSTFDKIYAAYKALQTEYDQKVNQARGEAAGAALVTGRNPATNRQIERTELQKLSITMLTGRHYLRNHSMVEPPGGLPEVDVPAAIEEGKETLFFEQAFDWPQLTYLFYPYFWAKKSNWTTLSSETDPDPLFAAFRQAGAARVVVPVRPAYTDAVLWYLETRGTQGVWQGGEPPRLDDADGLFAAIADEVRAQTDDLAGAVPEGEPWEFTVPTTLVWLQPDATLPAFS